MHRIDTVTATIFTVTSIRACWQSKSILLHMRWRGMQPGLNSKTIKGNVYTFFTHL